MDFCSGWLIRSISPEGLEGAVVAAGPAEKSKSNSP